MRSLPAPIYTHWQAAGEASPKRGKGLLRPFSWKTRKFSTTGQDITAFWRLAGKVYLQKKPGLSALLNICDLFSGSLDFLLRTPEMLNTGAEAYGVLLDAVSKHRGIGIDELDIEDIDFDKKFEIFYDEVNAIAYGAIASGHIPNDLPKAFKNYSAYAAELRKIHDSYTTGMQEHLPLFNESDETQ